MYAPKIIWETWAERQSGHPEGLPFVASWRRCTYGRPRAVRAGPQRWAAAPVTGRDLVVVLAYQVGPASPREPGPPLTTARGSFPCPRRQSNRCTVTTDLKWGPGRPPRGPPRRPCAASASLWIETDGVNRGNVDDPAIVLIRRERPGRVAALPVGTITPTRRDFTAAPHQAHRAGVSRRRRAWPARRRSAAHDAARGTIGEFRRVYEIVWGQPLDPPNFHRKVTGVPGLLTPTGATTNRDGGRPARLYRRGPATRLHPAILRAP